MTPGCFELTSGGGGMDADSTGNVLTGMVVKRETMLLLLEDEDGRPWDTWGRSEFRRPYT